MASPQDALRRYGGMYGQAKRNSNVLAEVVTVSGAVEVARIAVPLVGQTKQGYKSGRETREGSITIQKIDTHWELELYATLSQSLVDRRAARDNAPGALASRQFEFLTEIDDPDAWGKESWTLSGCQVWRLTVGFSITDDIIDREFPFTWESETPTSAFVVTSDAQGVQSRVPYVAGQPIPAF